MQVRKIMIGGAALALMMLGVATAQVGSLTAKPTRVAVVEFERLINGLKQKTAFEADRQAKARDLQALQQEKRQAVELLQQDLNMLSPGSTEYQDKQKELRRAALEFQLWGRLEQEEAQRMAMTELESLYRSAREMIGQVAQEAGYDLVLFEEGVPTFNAENLQQLGAQIGLRKVLYASDSIDITDEVMRRMNADFDATR